MCQSHKVGLIKNAGIFNELFQVSTKGLFYAKGRHLLLKRLQCFCIARITKLFRIEVIK